jgi:hypothetical protein
VLPFRFGKKCCQIIDVLITSTETRKRRAKFVSRGDAALQREYLRKEGKEKVHPNVEPTQRQSRVMAIVVLEGACRVLVQPVYATIDIITTS